jgi:hypothetical protein
MCITVNHAKLSKTKILSLPLENGNHFIAYSNKVKNLSGKPNAMILPIPGETSPALFHDTTKYKDFMDEITENCDLHEDYMGMRSRGMKGVLSFEQFELGMYTVGLSKNFNGVRDFIDALPEEKRPEISEELKSFFQEKYAGWSFAICVFDSDKTIDAQPIAFEYKPFGSQLLYFPTMDGHDGKAPNIDDMVNTDHTFIYEHTGSMEIPKGSFWGYEKQFVTLKAEVPGFLQNRKYRAVFSRNLQKNGDTFVNIDEMTASNFTEEPAFKRIHPVPNVAV